jgi:glycosyltransferase involved in cell wall biosynthesis
MASQAEILIDVSRLIWRLSRQRLPTGIDRVCLAYVAHYRQRARAVIHWNGVRRALAPAPSTALFDLLLSDTESFKSKLAQLTLRSLPGLLRSAPSQNCIYLNIGHTGLDRPGLSKWIMRSQVRPVFMVHDLIPITHPQYCRPGGAETHAKRIDQMLRLGAGIIGNSQATLDILSAYANLASLPLPAMVAAWLGATPLPASDTKPLKITQPFFVSLGTIEGRKNHLMLLQIWQSMIAQLGPSAPRLIIIGQRGWKADEAFTLLDNDATLRNHVIELPRCSDAELAHYLRDAQALLFPSFAEGFGMPLIEALGVGTPVIVSDLEVFRELAGDVPEYVPPSDQSAWQAAVLNYAMPDSTERNAQLSRMAGYKMPTWAEHFSKVDDWLDSLQL